MADLVWIILGGLLMSAIAMVGSVAILMKPAALEKLLLPLVALAAGTLLGGAFFHMVPEGGESLEVLEAATWLMGGFVTFLGLEQFLHWHHSHQNAAAYRKPVSYLILIGDAIHNFLGGVGIASTFLLDAKAGIIAWFAAAAHEVPQELGDFGILVHGGWPRRQALTWNLISGLTFPLGALLAYFAAQHFHVSGLVLFGAGNFVYIAASDLIPEIKGHGKLRGALLHFGCLVAGLMLMLVLAYAFHH
jgi:zinc and cadmium transporter